MAQQFGFRHFFRYSLERQWHEFFFIFFGSLYCLKRQNIIVLCGRFVNRLNHALLFISVVIPDASQPTNDDEQTTNGNGNDMRISAANWQFCTSTQWPQIAQ